MGKRILVTSIPSWNQKSGSNTWSSLLTFANSEDIANIYIDPALPDSRIASRYFNINESAVVKSVFNRRIVTGKEMSRINEIRDTHCLKSDKSNHNLSLVQKLKRKRWPILLWIRELAWMLGKWDSKELNCFIDDFNPEVLLFSIESYPYYNRLNEYIIDKFKPKKIVAYLWDDNFTYKQHPKGVLAKIERYFLRRQVKRLICKSSDILAISPKMKEECDLEFGINSTVLTKPIFNSGKFEAYQPKKPIRILYTGKLIIGRDKTIEEIAHAIQKINCDGEKVILDIYTNTILSDKERESIEITGCSILHPPVTQSEVLQLQKQADVLLFAESFSNRDLTARLSFSTKLTDYFAAGKCIWAVGNGELGPISYIGNENAGIVSTSIPSIYEALYRFIEDPAVIPEYAKKGFLCGLHKHNGKTIIGILRDSILSY